MHTKLFNNTLTVVSKPHNLSFFTNQKDHYGNYKIKITPELINYIKSEGSYCWDNINPKEANSLSSDYDEYYDKNLDNNGGLDLINSTKDDGINYLRFNAPSLTDNKLYQFNKRKFESFLYDLNKL